MGSVMDVRKGEMSSQEISPTEDWTLMPYPVMGLCSSSWTWCPAKSREFPFNSKEGKPHLIFNKMVNPSKQD